MFLSNKKNDEIKLNMMMNVLIWLKVLVIFLYAGYDLDWITRIHSTYQLGLYGAASALITWFDLI